MSAERDPKVTIYPMPVTIKCPHCGKEISVLFHQREVDYNGDASCDIPDIHDPIFCSRCGWKIQ
jgi:C4-type Zn-finger protein